MYFYSIGYGTFEESGYKTFTSPNKYSGEDIQKMVRSCAVKAYGEYFTSGYLGEGHTFEDFYDACTFQDLWEDYSLTERGFSIPQLLESDFGLIPLKPEVEASMFGWFKVDKPKNNWDIDRGVQENLLIDDIVTIYGENTTER